MGAETHPGQFDSYVATVLLERLAMAPDELVLVEDGTVVFVDISGFTKLSERLARGGREGAEHLVNTINACFSTLLADAYINGGSLLKFGGDALLLWFSGDDHPLRACASAVAMRRTLRRISPIRAGSSNVVLRMSVGVHSGVYESFLVGGSHREHLIAGPAVSVVVAMEAAAGAGQVLVSEQTAKLLPSKCLGASCPPGVLLARSPSVRPPGIRKAAARPADEVVAACLSTALRAHLQSAPAAPEHRTATVSFLQFGQLDALIAQDGPEAAAEAIDELARIVQDAADRYEVCVLGSDIAADGGKFLFSAGAPRAVGDDEERLLLTLRQVVEAEPRLPVRAGVNRGYVFTGEVGPPYRRTYVVMGDATNLAARLAAKADWGTIYATEGVLEHSQTRFALTPVPPFMVKGKSRPVQAQAVGAALRAASSTKAGKRLPLIGRDHELAILRGSVDRALQSKGAVIELVGETGSGKSRLLSEARQLAPGTRAVHVTCETYTRAIPYIAWRELLRQLLGLRSEASDAVALDQLEAQLTEARPELLPWLPLLAIAVGVEAPSTREVAELSPEFRTAKLHEVVLSFLGPALTVPTLVLVEHAHMMDEASAALLDALTTRIRDSSWVVIVTRRDVAGGFVSAARSSIRLELEPLSAAATLALAEATPEAHVIPPHVLELAVERSAGSPEFLLDLLSAATGGSGTLPDTIETAASALIDALDPRDRVLIRRAAVLGLTFRPNRLRHVLDDGVTEPGEETWRRLGAIFATDADGHIRFKRPALCEVAYEGLPFRLRRELHAVLGRALERDLGREVDADPAVLSLHFSRAGDHDRAWRYALMAAERATERFANADAVELYRRAIEAGRATGANPRELAGAWEALGEALTQVGEPGAATRALTSARRLIAGDRIAEARLYFRHGRIAERNELSAAVRWMRRGLRALEGLQGREARSWRARLVAELGWIRQRQGRHREAVRLCGEALGVAEQSGELLAEARACYTLDWAQFELSRAEATHSARALEIYRKLGDPQHEAMVLINLGARAYWQGRWQEAIDLYVRGGQCSERAGNAADVAFSEGNVGEILSDQGHLDEAASRLGRAHRLSSSTGDREGAAFASMLLGRLAVRVGRADEGILRIGAAAEEMHQLRFDYYADCASALVSEAEALGGSAERALAVADDLLTPNSRYVSLLRRSRGIALARLGDRTASLEELERSIAAAREIGEDYELVLSLDALKAVRPLGPDERRERDEILERLDIVRLPTLPGPDHQRVGEPPLAGVAGD